MILLVQQKNISRLKAALKHEDINGLYGGEGKSLLQVAIESNLLPVVKYLLKRGADIEMLSQGKTPLIHATQAGDIKIAGYLLKKGANIEGISDKNNTALIYASFLGNMQMVKFLIGKGANIDYVNTAGKSPLDYANQFQNVEVATYLRDLEIQSIAKYLPSYSDGPHIVYKNGNEVVIFYLIRDSLLNDQRVSSMEISIPPDSFLVRGFEQDTLTYWIYRKHTREPDVYADVENIFTVGDIHGSYDQVEELLINNHIIDRGQNWTFGKGHLVFMGDIFDRGDEVTKALWLIYRLEDEAKRAGGRVHYLLGNHEIMAMENDTRDLSTKYVYLTRVPNVEYSAFFSTDTELGQWLRSRNTMVKINDILFVHAGISPMLIRMNLGIEQVNKLMYQYLFNELDAKNDSTVIQLLGEEGPLWYRGYFGFGRTYKRITLDEMDSALNFYKVRTIVVGHTHVAKITSLFDWKVLATDIPFYEDGYELQGLLIRNGRFIRAFLDGKQEDVQ
jgi:hypothetical protein